MRACHTGNGAAMVISKPTTAVSVLAEALTKTSDPATVIRMLEARGFVLMPRTALPSLYQVDPKPKPARDKTGW